MTTESDSFPKRHARTQRFTLGAPRSFTVAPDGSRVAFLRSGTGTDRANSLWVLDVEEGTERVAADPRALLGGAEERLSPEERARRERSREGGAGIVGYATDAAVELAAFALSGRLYAAELGSGSVRELAAPGPVIDPRPAPDGRHVAYAARGALRVVGAEGDGDRALAEADGEGVAYGLAEFVAAEEMGRNRGFWWSPESDRLLVARVDDTPVQRWWISDPARPERDPQRVPYPAAGTPNADVRLFLVGLDGERTEVRWDRARYPYLARVHWSSAGAPLLLVQARDQRSQLFLAVDTESGSTRMVHADEDPIWLELFPGAPCWSPSGQLVRIADEGGARVLAVGERPLTGAQLHLRAVLDVGADDVLVSASAGEEAAEAEPGEVHVYRVNELGVERVSQEPGVHTAARAGGVTVLVSATLDRPGARAHVLRDGKQTATVASYAEDPGLTPRVTLTQGGARRVPCAVLMPTDYHGDTPLPVLLDPYGGPHGQRVVAAHNAHLTSQWFADQGFAVVVADGRGTPGRSPAWEKSVKDDIAAVVLQDQVDALHALAADFPLDLDRVAIRGWSFGGYLAALAALRRPDVFHAAVVGAPVTDLRLYDTHYQERYLGDPAERPEVYRRNSVIDDAGLVDAAEPHRPMMVIHGLADDNVVVAHSLRLSSALLAAGRPHEVLPLSGVTHMTPQESVAENLLRLQVDFLKRSLPAPKR
ncbi:prolyl oligopeptidase family serine peptidase [Streptomyces olivaceus]|uniref:Prolyl oligopeptidase family serine peptidase n=1 Tax=Streptomyces olivaceus TaxID=47716 RepID=A0ABS7VWX3_STROV|nr:prolyl oligopeptidase family serine peptidase [Streptomyces olivaceus]MBZ6087358.1 prolyl oligopeptidase family serine peptidase [Streptomyces olivaceus]MBZ6094041.1 prolyl oligopeptidase family serine peptidase [Streptomyces olivaceus]MBZ6115157.1 prolyl oligopeptidase family serine peptidase [Streptomyces olivaceus]MBZ6150202.1 prolyl oligopeptidase family serine peptidase [Streptomyces olivaceus]MBZ6198753.1 prolyl oligopeptidase family serine peptidase [Streptomyces olivaceus]